MANKVQHNPEYPLPPSDFQQRTLSIQTQKITLYRLNQASYKSAIYFDRSGMGRYDSPQQSYGILYTAESVRGAFIESFGRVRGKLGVAIADLKSRNLFEIKSERELNLVNLWGDGLVKMGADSSITSGINYEIARIWGEHIYLHPQKVDGIFYLSRHDNTQMCCGIFDRVRDSLTEKNTGNLYDSHAELLGDILDCYDYGLL